MSKAEKIPILSLFCGCGGFDLGFVAQNYNVVLALDVNEPAVETYNRNHGQGIARVCDLATTHGRDIVKIIEENGLEHPRGVIGGAPCQTFSDGNVYKKKRDPRHSLPRKYARLLNDLNKKYSLDFFVFENVRGLSGKTHRGTFAQFKTLFRKAGFRLFGATLDALEFGVAQLPEPVLFARNLTPTDIKHHPNHWTMRPKSEKFWNGKLKAGQNHGRSFRVLSWDKPSWAVAYGHREIHIHPSGKRRLSVYEAMLLQGLPTWYHLTGSLSAQVQQVSDTVPRQLGAALARQIRHCLKF